MGWLWCSAEGVESRAAKGYDATVDELIQANSSLPADEYVLLRYQPAALLPGGNPPMGNVNWMFHLVNTQRPLEEKMALFWHHVFATGNSKVDNYDQLLAQIAMFRQRGMGNYRELLLALAKDPAMIYWLDNNENHKDAVNENWGRELLELFSMGQGNYTENDVREASRALPVGRSQSRSRACRTDVSLGNSNTSLKTTMTGRKNFSVTLVISTVRTLSTSLCRSPPAVVSLPAIFTTFSLRTNPRYQAGRSCRHVMRQQWMAGQCFPRNRAMR